MIQVLLADPSAELTKAIRGHGAHPNWVLYAIADILAGANWQRSGGRSARPRPFDQMLANQAKAAELAKLQAAAQDPESELFAQLAYLSKFAPAAETDPAAELWLPDGTRSD